MAEFSESSVKFSILIFLFYMVKAKKNVLSYKIVQIEILERKIRISRRIPGFISSNRSILIFRFACVLTIKGTRVLGVLPLFIQPLYIPSHHHTTRPHYYIPYRCIARKLFFVLLIFKKHIYRYNTVSMTY